jgi:hypothetical protein
MSLSEERIREIVREEIDAWLRSSKLDVTAITRKVLGQTPDIPLMVSPAGPEKAS